MVWFSQRSGTEAGGRGSGGICGSVWGNDPVQQRPQSAPYEAYDPDSASYRPDAADAA